MSPFPYRPGALGRARPGQRGQTMLLVAMLSTVTLGLTAVAFRTTDDAVQTETFQDDRDLRDEVISSAIGRAVELLRTGDPPMNPYRYVETFVLDGGKKFYTQVTFEQQSSMSGLAFGSDSFTVVATPGTLADLLRFGPPPEHFGDTDEDDGHGRGGDGDDDDEDEDEGDDGNHGDDGDGCGDQEGRGGDRGDCDDGKEKGRGWGVGGIPPGSDEGGKNGWCGDDKPPGNPGPEKNDGNKGQSDKGKGKKDD